MILEGKAYWCNLREPNKLYGYYGLLITINKSMYLKFKKEGFAVRDTKWGYCLNIRTKPKDGYKPILLDKNERKLKMFGDMPDGSNVKVKFDNFETKHLYGTYKGTTLMSVMLLDEVPKLFI